LGCVPDLVDDDKVFAVAVVEQPVRLADAEGEGRERGVVHCCRRFGEIESGGGLFRDGLEVLE
jgi:hypothetical protein